MKTVNSLSGGKTSSYIAANFPADLEVFALVCIDDHNSNVGSTTYKIDRKVRQMVNDRLQKYCSDQPEFRATAEDPITIKTMFDLEQFIGREIIWLRGDGWQQISNTKKLIPNKQHRYCTTVLKIEPIFRFLFKYHSLPVKMRIGYRKDEEERAHRFKEAYMYSTHCEMHIDNDGYYLQKGRYPVNRLGFSYAHRWKEVPFRVGEFPLVEAGVTQADIQRYWKGKPVEFANDSNCQFCFWKHPQQLRKNFDSQPSTMATALVMEEMMGGTFHHAFSMQQIREIGVQHDLFQMKGSGCHGGYCTS